MDEGVVVSSVVVKESTAGGAALGDASQGPARAEAPGAPPIVRLLGVPLHSATLAGAVDHVARSALAGVGGWVITPNLDILRRLVREPEFVALSSGATLRLADGQILVWASRMRGSPLPERVAGSDLIWALTARAARDGLGVFFLGGNPGSAQAAADVLTEKNPGLRVVGVECPPFGFEGDAAYCAGLREKIRAANPAIVYVALGSPKQETLIAQLREVVPGAWLLGIGVTFSFVSGELRRAPVWVRKIGMEWFHRLVQEPRRLAKRYLVHGLPFAGRLILAALLERLTGAAKRDDR